MCKMLDSKKKITLTHYQGEIFWNPVATVEHVLAVHLQTHIYFIRAAKTNSEKKAPFSLLSLTLSYNL